jgi:long-chain acyl-CoA synthetase
LLGLWSQALVCVPLYDTLGASSVEFILTDASVSTIFVAPDKLKHTLAAAKAYPGLRTLVVFGDVTPEMEAAAAAASEGLALVSYAALLQEGRAAAVPVSPPTPAALAYIMYTSGGSPLSVSFARPGCSCREVFLRHDGQPQGGDADAQEHSRVSLGPVPFWH